MCGIIGIHSASPVGQSIFDALTVLQHRGQDAAGIVTEQDGRFYLKKANGLVRDVFRTRHMTRLLGNKGIGHVRYPTAGSASSAESQPFYVNSPYGIALAHNGSLTNYEQLAQCLFEDDLRHVNTHSDSEVLLNVFAHELQQLHKLKPDSADVFSAVTQVMHRIKGGYAVDAMLSGYGLLGFRDPNGIRPLVYGQRITDDGNLEYMLASESVALDALGFTLIADVQPGQAVYIDENGQLHLHQCVAGEKKAPCIFEYVYFARPDSILDGSSVYKSRLRMGEYLADKILATWPEHDIDVVIPIPESSRPCAIELANHLGVKFREGFVKNRYIGRTFIMPGQAARKKSVRQKLNPIGLEFKNKVVLLVDDSIVRGTTSQQIIDMARDAGAKKVYFASAAPAIRFPNVYGIDMAVKNELIAFEKTEKEVEQAIGADWLIYQDVKDLIRACIPVDSQEDRQFDCSVFDGQYVTGDIDDRFLKRLESSRADGAKSGDAAHLGNLHHNGQ